MIVTYFKTLSRFQMHYISPVTEENLSLMLNPTSYNKTNQMHQCLNLFLE